MRVSQIRIYIPLLITLPIIVFYIVVNYLVVNVPYQDDFDGLLQPTTILQKGVKSVKEFWHVLWVQDDERRIVMNRIVAYGTFLIFGNLDLTKQILAGVSSLTVLTSFLLAWFRRHRIDYKYFIPIPFLLFNLHFFDAVQWANIPVQQIGVFAWAFIALFFLTSEDDGKRWIGIIFGILSLYSDVSGAFLFPVGILVLAAQKKWTIMGGWILILGLITFLYFYHLEVPGYRPSMINNLAHPLQLLVMYITMHGLWIDPGDGFEFPVRQAVTFITGFVMFGLFLRILISKVFLLLKEKQPLRNDELFTLGSLSFLTSVCLIFVIGRASEGFGAIYITRYHLIYVFWAVFFYCFFLISFKNTISRIKYLNPILISGSMIYCFAAYFHFWVDADYFRRLLLTDGYEWKNNRALPSSPIYLTAQIDVDNIYAEAYKSGVYTGVHYPFADLFDAPVMGTTLVESAQGTHFVTLRFPEIARGYGRNDGVYVLLESGNERHIFATRHNTRSFIEAIKNRSYYYAGADSTPILKAYLRSGKYTVSAGVIDGDQHYRYKVAEPLVVKH